MSDLSSLMRDWTHSPTPHWKYGISTTGLPEKSLIISWNYHLFAYITHLLLHVVNFFTWSSEKMDKLISSVSVQAYNSCDFALSLQTIFFFSGLLTWLVHFCCKLNTTHWYQFSSVAQSCSTLCDPIDGSLPGSSIHGIFQVRVLEWGAIAFSITRCSGNQKFFSFFKVTFLGLICGICVPCDVLPLISVFWFFSCFYFSTWSPRGFPWACVCY